MAVGSSACPHISTALEDQSIGSELASKYASVVAWNVHRTQNGRAAKRRKVRHLQSKSSNDLVQAQQIAAPTCGTCDSALSRPLACLQCSYIGCWHDGHATRHLKDAGHSFCELIMNNFLEYFLLKLHLNRHGRQNWIPVLLDV